MARIYHNNRRFLQAGYILIPLMLIASLAVLLSLALALPVAERKAQPSQVTETVSVDRALRKKVRVESVL